MNDKLKVLDLFSGIGGFSLGLERTGGFETVAFCEIEDYPSRVLKKHWPEVPIYKDVRDITAEQLTRDGIVADVITGGFPCQDVSASGHHRGLGKTRSGLWSELHRLIGEIRPQYAIVENVTNLLSGPSEQRGGWFGRVLGDLAEVGFDAEWHCLQAGHLGAPHGRDRVWLVAYPHGQRCGMLAEAFQIQSATFDMESREPWEPNPLSVLPDLGRLFRKPSGGPERNDNGLPEALDRLKGYGNAVVPQVVTMIGNAILEAEK